MSTIITASVKEGRFMMMFNAPDVRTIVHGTDFNNWIFDITGEPEHPFIYGVRFINCKIIADNLKSFNSCFFHDDCEMIIKDMSVIDYPLINNNRVLKPSTNTQKHDLKEAIVEIEAAEGSQRKLNNHRGN